MSAPGQTLEEPHIHTNLKCLIECHLLQQIAFSIGSNFGRTVKQTFDNSHRTKNTLKSQMNKGSQLNKESGVSNEQGVSAEQGIRGLK